MTHLNLFSLKLPMMYLKWEKNIIIRVIYRPPGTDLSLFNSKIADLLEKNKLENKLYYLMGDYNINLSNYETHELTVNFIDTIYSYAFVPLINRPTRVSKYSATLIDNILTNNHKASVQCCQGILVTNISDHFPIIHINHNFIGTVQAVFILKRLYSVRNKHAFFII